MRISMPQNKPGSLSRQQVADLVALTPLETARELTLCLPWLAELLSTLLRPTAPPPRGARRS